MKKRIALVAALLGAIISAFAGVAMAAPSPGGNTTCTSATDLQGQTILTNVTVPAGETCNLTGADIKGNVTSAGRVVTFGYTHFAKNLTITAGGQFQDINNGNVVIDQNLSITDPAVNTGNGFWGDQYNTSSTVKGNLSYTITPTAAGAYPQYQWPYLYFGGPTHVNGSVTYSVGALSSVRPFNQDNLTVAGSINLS